MAQRNPTCGCGEEAICNETELDCLPCCRCIPQRFCANLEAEDCPCDGLGALLTGGNPNSPVITWTGTLSCDGEEMDLLVSLVEIDGSCFWRVVSNHFYIDEFFEISSSGQPCDKPEFVVNAPFETCPGVVRIVKHELHTIPFGEDADGCIDPETICGCRCVSKKLCIYENLDGYISHYEAEWDDDISGWVREDGYTYLLEWNDYIDLCFFNAGSFWGEPKYDFGSCDDVDVGFESAGGDFLQIRSLRCGCDPTCCLPTFPEKVTVTFENLSGCPDIDGLEVDLYNPREPGDGLHWLFLGGNYEIPIMCEPPYGGAAVDIIPALWCGGSCSSGWGWTLYNQGGCDSFPWVFIEEESSQDPLFLVFEADFDNSGCPCCDGPIHLRAVVTE